MIATIEIPDPPYGFKIDRWRMAEYGELYLSPIAKGWVMWKEHFPSATVNIVAVPVPPKPKRKVWPLKLTPDGRPFVAFHNDGEWVLTGQGPTRPPVGPAGLILDDPIEIED